MATVTVTAAIGVAADVAVIATAAACDGASTSSVSTARVAVAAVAASSVRPALTTPIDSTLLCAIAGAEDPYHQMLSYGDVGCDYVSLATYAPYRGWCGESRCTRLDATIYPFHLLCVSLLRCLALLVVSSHPLGRYKFVSCPCPRYVTVMIPTLGREGVVVYLVLYHWRSVVCRVSCVVCRLSSVVLQHQQSVLTSPSQFIPH